MLFYFQKKLCKIKLITFKLLLITLCHNFVICRYVLNFQQNIKHRGELQYAFYLYIMKFAGLINTMYMHTYLLVRLYLSDKSLFQAFVGVQPDLRIAADGEKFIVDR